MNMHERVRGKMIKKPLQVNSTILIYSWNSFILNYQDCRQQVHEKWPCECVWDVDGSLSAVNFVASKKKGEYFEGLILRFYYNLADAFLWFQKQLFRVQKVFQFPLD